MQVTQQTPVFYPDSLRVIGEALSFFSKPESARPDTFALNAPVALGIIVDYFELVHAWHLRALSALRACAESGEPYCLYLRSYSMAGGAGSHTDVTETGAKRQLYLTRGDADLRASIEEHALHTVISCFNTFDAFSLGGGQAASPAILRLASHNWRTQVDGLIDGAQSIVLRMVADANGALRPGVSHEWSRIVALGQASRTILLLDDLTSYEKGAHPHAALAWRWGETAEMAKLLRGLSSDGHRRVRREPMPSLAPCYVVDRGFAAERFESGELKEAAYLSYVPEDLRTNLVALTDGRSNLHEAWRALEQKLAQPSGPETEYVVRVMMLALRMFVVAATLESYEDMTRSLVAAAHCHKMIRRDPSFSRQCLSGAVRCARMGGLAELEAFFGEALAAWPDA